MRPYCQFGSSASHGFHCSRLEHILAPPAQGLWRNGSAPDQKVGSSNLSGLIYSPFALSMSTHTENTKTYSKLKNPKKLRFGIDKPKANTANHCEPLYLEITTCSQQVPSFPSSVIGPFGPGCTCCKASMQWEGQSACVQVSASNEELQKMFAERERTAECRQKTLCPSG